MYLIYITYLLPNCSTLRDEPRHCVHMVPPKMQITYFFIPPGTSAHKLYRAIINYTPNETNFKVLKQFLTSGE